MWVIDPGYYGADRWNPTTSVQIDVNERRDTGLLTPDGRRIFKEPNEIGFGRKQDIYSVE